MEKGKTSHSQEIVGKRLQEELGSSDRTGKLVKCEDNRVMNVHDRTGKPWNQAHTHTMQEFGSPGHRDTLSSNANKFNLAIDEENIDFNISGVPNAMVKRSHGINFSKSRTTLSDKHFKVIFNNIKHSIPSAKNQKMRLQLLGTLNYAR